MIISEAWANQFLSLSVLNKDSVHEFFDCVLDGLDLALQLFRFVRSHTSRNNRPRNTARSPESNLRRHKDIRHILDTLLAPRRQTWIAVAARKNMA